MADPADTLDVYLGVLPVGVLSADPQGRLAFHYRPDAPPLSYRLPVRAEPYDDAACRPFFAGLLPEGPALTKAAARKGLQVYETFRLLVAYGGECAGAVRLLPPGSPPAIPSDYEPFSDEQLANLGEELQGSPNFSADRRVRLSLAGAQVKSAVALFGSRFHRPLGGSPSTHIVKSSDRPEYHDLVRNEAFCMALAVRAGLDVAATRIMAFGGRECLLVERYDRIVEGTLVTELHQEDVCQALGYPPERKYEFDDDSGVRIGPGFADCLALLQTVRAPILALREFRRRALFNFLVGNADAHGKNTSLLYDQPGSAPMLAPAYDIVCTRLYPDLKEDFAMAYGEARRAAELTADNLARLAPPGRAARKAFLDDAHAMASRILAQARALCDEAPFNHAPPYSTILSCIGDRVQLLGDILGRPIAVDTRPFILKGGGWLLPS